MTSSSTGTSESLVPILIIAPFKVPMDGGGNLGGGAFCHVLPDEAFRLVAMGLAVDLPADWRELHDNLVWRPMEVLRNEWPSSHGEDMSEYLGRALFKHRGLRGVEGLATFQNSIETHFDLRGNIRQTDHTGAELQNNQENIRHLLNSLIPKTIDRWRSGLLSFAGINAEIDGPKLVRERTAPIVDVEMGMRPAIWEWHFSSLSHRRQTAAAWRDQYARAWYRWQFTRILAGIVDKLRSGEWFCRGIPLTPEGADRRHVIVPHGYWHTEHKSTAQLNLGKPHEYDPDERGAWLRASKTGKYVDEVIYSELQIFGRAINREIALEYRKSGDLTQDKITEEVRDYLNIAVAEGRRLTIAQIIDHLKSQFGNESFPNDWARKAIKAAVEEGGFSTVIARGRPKKMITGSASQPTETARGKTKKR